MHLVILQEPPLEIIEGKKEKQKNPIRSYSSPQMECKYNSFLINMAVKSKSLEHVWGYIYHDKWNHGIIWF
jgi:hypothetical protein